MAATAEVLPVGNEWKFSNRSYRPEFRPGLRTSVEYHPTGLLQAVTQHVQERFIVDGWEFAALIKGLPGARDDNNPGLTVIFTHPARTESRALGIYDLKEFIKPDAGNINREQFFSEGIVEDDDPINETLRGSNFVAELLWAGYFEIKVGQRAFWQSGVGFFDISLSSYEQRIIFLNTQIEERMRTVHPLQERKAALETLQSPNPVPLFQ